MNVSRRALLAGMSAVPLAGMLPRPARAASGTIRIVMKDLLTTNPEDVQLLKNIEAGMAAQGHDVSIEIVDPATSERIHSYAAALQLDMVRTGTAEVELREHQHAARFQQVADLAGVASAQQGLAIAADFGADPRLELCGRKHAPLLTARSGHGSLAWRPRSIALIRKLVYIIPAAAQDNIGQAFGARAEEGRESGQANSAGGRRGR